MRTLFHSLVIFATTGFSGIQATELITNGDFESGLLTGWIKAEISGSGGQFSPMDYADFFSPISSHATGANPVGDQYFAISDTNDPGSHSLRQTFTIPSTPQSVILTFDMFVDNYADSVAINPGLDYNAGQNQHARVDLLNASGGAFDTGSNVLVNLYSGADSTAPNDFLPYSFDITAFVTTPGTYIIRFANVETDNTLVQGVDNVSVDFNSIPEPSSLTLLGGVLIPLSLRRRRR